MNRKLILVILLLFLNNCATPGSALLGPIITGAKTGSIYQASLSYGTGKVMNSLKPYEFIFNDDTQQNTTINLSNIQNYNDLPEILISYKIDKIEFSDPVEPEPLP